MIQLEEVAGGGYLVVGHLVEMSFVEEQAPLAEVEELHQSAVA